ncbi:816_t:CDS:2, partial [Scutellospora calospora]
YLDFLISKTSNKNVSDQTLYSSLQTNNINIRNGYTRGKKRRQHLHNTIPSTSSASNSSTNEFIKNKKLSEEQRRKLVGKLSAISRGKDSIFPDGKICDLSPDSTIIPLRIRQTTRSHQLFPPIDDTINNVIINPKSIKITILHMPPEIMLCIFDFLPSRKDFYSCLFVCKVWYLMVTPFLYKSPQIYHRFSSMDVIVDLNEITSTHLSSTKFKSSLSSKTRLPLNFPLEKYGSFIKILDLSIGYGYDYISDSTIQAIAHSCPNLRVINLNNCIHISDISLESISKNQCSSTLISISLCGCRKITDLGIKMLSKSCQNLNSLNLADCGKITDKSIIMIAKGCSKLRQIRLSDCPRITEKSIEALILNCPRLCWLDIARIGRITDYTIRLIANTCKDNIEWLNLARPSPLEAVYSSALATQLRRKSGHLGCITMGDAVGITEEDIESITNEPEGLLSGWQKSSVDENSLKEILEGVSWEDVGT